MPARPPSRLRFHCVNDGVPEETMSTLRAACAERGIDYRDIDARRFDFTTVQPLGRGDLLYRPAASWIAMRVEQALYSPAAATFYANDWGVFHDCLLPPLLFERAGLAIPRTVYAATPDRDKLRGIVEWLGGFPIVAKWLGHAGGTAVLRVDSFPALFSVMDYAGDGAIPPLLSEYIADAVHFRLVVVGDRIAAGYRNLQAADDFRSMGSEDPADYRLPINPAMAALAVSAARVLGVETAGVDILRAPDGGLFLLEANFPCYFAQAQIVAGIDVAGMMVDHLIKKAGTRPA